jgi:hypothetical protein
MRARIHEQRGRRVTGMRWLGLMAVSAMLTGCAAASPYATTAYCTPAGVRTLPTAAVAGLVGSVNAAPAGGVCRAFSTRPDAAAAPPAGGATPSAETSPPTK